MNSINKLTIQQIEENETVVQEYNYDFSGKYPIFNENLFPTVRQGFTFQYFEKVAIELLRENVVDTLSSFKDTQCIITHDENNNYLIKCDSSIQLNHYTAIYISSGIDCIISHWSPLNFPATIVVGGPEKHHEKSGEWDTMYYRTFMHPIANSAKDEYFFVDFNDGMVCISTLFEKVEGNISVNTYLDNDYITSAGCDCCCENDVVSTITTIYEISDAKTFYRTIMDDSTTVLKDIRDDFEDYCRSIEYLDDPRTLLPNQLDTDTFYTFNPYDSRHLRLIEACILRNPDKHFYIFTVKTNSTLTHYFTIPNSSNMEKIIEYTKKLDDTVINRLVQSNVTRNEIVTGLAINTDESSWSFFYVTMKNTGWMTEHGLYHDLH